MLLFLGGWLRRSFAVRCRAAWIPPRAGSGLAARKVFVVVTMFLWVRATFPRYRYDQIMRLGWKVFIPLTLVWIVVVGVWMQSPWIIWNWIAKAP